MAFQQAPCDEEGVLLDAIESPEEEGQFVAVLDRSGIKIFGLGVIDSDGNAQAWFPWGGEEIGKKGGFSFLVKNPAYSYTWILLSQYLKRKDHYSPLTVENESGEGVVPASFAGRLGKLNLSHTKGFTCFGGNECERDAEEVNNAKILCVREKNTQCILKYQPSRQGAYPPVDAVRAKQCQFRSYVVLSTDYDPPQFGRACLNKYCDGLQAWFPYAGKEDLKESFRILRTGDWVYLYWAPIREVKENATKHEVLKYGIQSPAVMDGILGKLHIDTLDGWISYDGVERKLDEADVLNGFVLCYKDIDECREVHDDQ